MASEQTRERPGADLRSALRATLVAAVAAWSDSTPTPLDAGQLRSLLEPVRPPKPDMGDFALPCFPLAKPFRRNPAEIAAALEAPVAAALAQAATAQDVPRLARLAATGPYLNLFLDPPSLAAWIAGRIASGAAPYGTALPANGRRTLVEYSAPNTNKPLHLGHVRNNLLGLSLCQLLAAAGDEVIPVNLVNDRGIHIARSMVAYRRWGADATPQSSGQKGDHFVGSFYVRFGEALKAETAQLATQRGLDPALLDDDARRALEEETTLVQETRACLRAWEAEDEETRALWRRMNAWVYAGFDATYTRLGCHFRHWYLESETYQQGKRLVEDGLARGLFERREDGSIWAPLTRLAPDSGLKDKLVLRSDGTSVYATQDLGTAWHKFQDFAMDRSLYVVASEQNHHFRVLFLLLELLGFPWAKGCEHVSYGLVVLPHGMGKLKSREGRAVDADALLDELAALARTKARTGGYVTEEAVDFDALADAIGQGALKMYLLQVGAEKNITFDPDRTLEFEGDTGPAVQYSHARICSIVRKALAAGLVAREDLIVVTTPDPLGSLGTGSPVPAPAGTIPSLAAAEAATDPEAALIRTAAGLAPKLVDAALLKSPEEHALCLQLAELPAALAQAVQQLSPAPMAAYLIELTKAYARFYHSCPVLRAESRALARARLHLCLAVAATLRRGLGLLGIQAPSRM